MNNTISIKIITQEDVAAIFDSHADRLFEIVCHSALCSASRVVEINGVHVIGERINPCLLYTSNRPRD